MAMRRVCILLAVAAGIGSLAASSVKAGTPETPSLDPLLDAIATVESQNGLRPVGDGGRAIGPYQIHRDYWRDGTRFLGGDWPYEDARNGVKAREVVRAYLLYYGKGKSLIELARIHNGGPDGDRKASTLHYAAKIKRILVSRAATS